MSYTLPNSRNSVLNLKLKLRVDGGVVMLKPMKMRGNENLSAVAMLVNIICVLFWDNIVPVPENEIII